MAPEGDEDWRATLEREVLEEACARVDEASLLGFSRGVCIKGHEQGLVLVRALWSAVVTLNPWDPRHEMTHRRLVSAKTVLDYIDVPDGNLPLIERWCHESLVHLAFRHPGRNCCSLLRLQQWEYCNSSGAYRG